MTLSREALGAMISRSQFEPAAEQLLASLGRAGVFGPGEQEALERALNDEDARRDLVIAINGLLHGKRTIKERVEHLLVVLSRNRLLSWPMLTVWLFLLHPDRYALVRREQLLGLAQQQGLEIDLPDSPDWPAFQTSQRIAQRLVREHAGSDLLDLAMVGRM